MAVTLKDIAKKAGVSYSTVSRAVNKETQMLVNPRTREHVLRAVEKYGYAPHRYTRNLKVRIKKNYMFGFIADVFPHHMMGEFARRVLFGAQEAAENLHVDLEIFPLLNRKAGEISRQVLLGHVLDGLLIFGSEGRGTFSDRLAELNIPVVTVNGYEPGQEEKNYVYGDGRKASREAVEHLISQGYMKIAMVIGSAITHDTEQRLLGYEDALRAHGLSISPNLVFQGGLSKKSGYEVGREIWARLGSLPRAIFCTNDDVAIGILKFCHAQGVCVPGEVAIVCFDDGDQASYAVPSLTAIRQPAIELGRRAVYLLNNLLEKKCAAPQRIEVPTELIIRDSSVLGPRVVEPIVKALRA